MKERPILFQGAMVRAILDGTKTQTRRLVKPAPGEYWNPAVGTYNPVVIKNGGYEAPGPEIFGASDETEGRKCPYGKPGDQLWVRESWRVTEKHDKTKPIDLPYDRGLTTFYEAGGSRARQAVGGPYVNDDEYPYPCMPDWVGKGRPSIHMPRVASRIQLEIVSVRVERLQAISEADALAEGCRQSACGPDYTLYKRWAYRNLWEEINGAGSWDVDPWVWVVEFKRVQP